MYSDHILAASLPGFTDLQTWQEVIDRIAEDFPYDA